MPPGRPRAAVPLDTVKFAGIEQLNANRHKCGDLPVAPAHGSAALLQQRESQRLWPRPMPRIPAFRRSALSVRFIFLAISGRGVRAFECALSSRTSSLVQGVRWAGSSSSALLLRERLEAADNTPSAADAREQKKRVSEGQHGVVEF